MRRLRLFLSAFVLVTILVSTELFSQYYANSHTYLALYLKHRPPAYEYSPFYSEAFILEQAQALGSLVFDEDGDKTSDFHGIWYNFDGGYRRTTEQPANALHTIYVFGSSTILGLEVPDAYTIPSRLQALFGKSYRVVNLGQQADFSRKALHRLQRLTIMPGDIVIFYDGVVDASAYVPDLRESAWYGKLCNFLQERLSTLKSIYLACRYADMLLPPDSADIAPTVAQVIHEAEIYTRARHAQFYHFVQPMLYSMPLSEQEIEATADPLLIDGSLRAAVLGEWKEVQLGHQLANVPGADLTHSLDDVRRQGTAIYFDFDHINEQGNALVARQIADVIAPTF